MLARIAVSDASSRSSSCLVSSATICVTMMRGSCITAWPRPTPSATGEPFNARWRREAISDPGRTIACSSPDAIISARSMAMVSRTSISSSE